MIMRWLMVLALAVATCHADFVFPDEWQKIQHRNSQEEQSQQFTNGGLLVFPPFEPTDPTPQFANEIEQPNNNGFNNGFQLADSVPSITGRVTPPPSVGSKPQSQSLETFLPPRWSDHVLNIISRGSAQFTLDMDRAIDNSSVVLSDENVLFSPMSLISTLAMVLLASGGQTFQELAKLLGLETGIDISHHSEVVHQLFGLLIQEGGRRRIANPDLPETKFAFGLFVQDSFPIREEFRAASENFYKNDVISVDFAQHSHESQKIVNDWVSQRTNNKIQNMLAEPPSPLTEIIITSALYFSGEWETHFAEGGVTRRRPFNVEPDQTVYVDMMANGGEFPFLEDKELGLKIIGLPYKGGEATMYAVLPNTPGRAALRQLKRQLSPELLNGLVSRMENRTCIVGFPRMKLSSSLKLQGALQSLGLTSLFDPLRADLSILSPGRAGASGHVPVHPTSGKQPKSTTPYGHFSYETDGYKVEQWPYGYKIQPNQKRQKRQSRPIDNEFVQFLETLNLPNFGIDELRNSAGISNPGLYADDVIHRVEMTVNERGTEAAAATSLSLDRGGDIRRFNANRPFLFFIRHEPAGIISFWGTINRPTPFYNSL